MKRCKKNDCNQYAQLRVNKNSLRKTVKSLSAAHGTNSNPGVVDVKIHEYKHEEFCYYHQKQNKKLLMPSNYANLPWLKR